MPPVNYPAFVRGQGWAWCAPPPDITRLPIVGSIKDTDDLAFGMRPAIQERTRLYIKCTLHSSMHAIQCVKNHYDGFPTNQKSYLTIVSPRKISLIRKRVCEAQSVITYPYNPQEILHRALGDFNPVVRRFKAL
jgi:hypothetical protein